MFAVVKNVFGLRLWGTVILFQRDRQREALALEQNRGLPQGANQNVPTASDGESTSAMWAVPVVLSPSLAVGTFLVCALGQSAILFQRESLTLAIAFENESDFIQNLCCFRAEERAALAVVLPAGIVGGSFAAGLQSSLSQPPVPPVKK